MQDNLITCQNFILIPALFLRKKQGSLQKEQCSQTASLFFANKILKGQSHNESIFISFFTDFLSQLNQLLGYTVENNEENVDS